MRVLLALLALWAPPALGQTLSRLLVPLYSYPCPVGQACQDEGFPFWSGVAAAARLCVETIAIVNVQNGPGSGIDTQYVVALDTLAQAGAKRIGYVKTQFGARSPEAIESDMDTWKTLYGSRIQGIFFDEVSSSVSDAGFYSALCDYARSQGFALTVLNPGTQPEEGWTTTCDVVTTFEDNHVAWQSHSLRSDLRALGAERLAAIVHTAPSGAMSSVFAEAEQEGYGSVYITDDILPNPYNFLPGYWEDEVALFTENVAAPTRYVAPTGSDASNDCSDAVDPCLTISHAAGQASAGAILCLAAGTYVEPGLVLDEALTLRGAGVLVR